MPIGAIIMMTETLPVYAYWEASLNWTCNGRLIP